mgnify:CR=1 FL=1
MIALKRLNEVRQVASEERAAKLEQKGFTRIGGSAEAEGRPVTEADLEKLGDAFIAAAVMDHCVCLYSMEEWDKLQQGLAEMPMTKARKLQRYLSANASDVQVDAQGRILLPANLRQHAKLEKDVTVIGVGRHAEIWNTQAWQQMNERLRSGPIAAAMEELEF